MMAIHVVASVVRAEEKALVKACASQGIPADILLTDELVLTPRRAYPANAIFLMRTPSYFAGTQVSWVLENLGYAVLNPHWQISLFGQKVTTDHWLARAGIPIIPSAVLFGDAQLRTAAQRLGYPLIIKPNIGGFGNLVHTVESDRELSQACAYLKAFAPSHHQTIFLQRKLDVQRNLRVNLLGGQVLTVIERFGVDEGPVNVSRGAVGEPYNLAEPEAALMARLGELLPHGFLGVDVLVTREGQPFICDVNPACGFWESVRVTEVDIAAEVVRNALETQDWEAVRTPRQPAVS